MSFEKDYSGTLERLVGCFLGRLREQYDADAVSLADDNDCGADAERYDRTDHGPNHGADDRARGDDGRARRAARGGREP